MSRTLDTSILPLALAGLALLGFVTTPAIAEKHVWPTGTGFRVRATDLDLQRPDHRARLLRRVEHASARLCLDRDTRDLRLACTASVLAETIAAAPVHLRPALARAIAERDGMAVASR